MTFSLLSVAFTVAPRLPLGLVMRAAGVGLDVISLTDHDTFDGLEEAHAAGGRFGVKVLPGIEITCREKDVDVHLLGYGCHPDDAQLGAELERTRASRLGRLHRICQKLPTWTCRSPLRRSCGTRAPPTAWDAHTWPMP